MKDFNVYYDKILETELFDNENSYDLSSKYNELYNRPSIEHIIIDFCTMLESILTMGGKEEKGFRISLNYAFLFARNYNEFEEKFRFIKKIYDIRGDLVHGKDWKKKN